ncbi:MAG TPA: DUF2382 domain-containing protein [Thermomicrobiales bacterium]|nr:DUF2382 domain-containing protein [Thermomicrobiales bacterium]
MNTWQATEGARVVDEHGQELGVVERVDATAPTFILVRTHREQRAVRIPITIVDRAASTADRIVVPGMGGQLATAADAAAAEGPLTIPVVAEQAFATVREVEQGRAVIEKRVEVVPHVAKIDVGTDEVEVERVRLDQEVDTAPTVRQEGDTLIVPVIEEVLVVTKRYIVREEVRVTKRRVVREETLHEDLQREVVDVREEQYGPSEER